MQAKFFEVRDRDICYRIVAFRLVTENAAERYLCQRVGYAIPEAHVIVCHLESGLASSYDPFSWGPSRTMRVAHQHLINRFDSLESGSVIDVECLLGEQIEPKKSETEKEEANRKES